jgi:hypothetical protein
VDAGGTEVLACCRNPAKASVLNELAADFKTIKVLPLDVAVLGVACAATCAPLNPSYREDDFDFCFGDLGVRAVIPWLVVSFVAMSLLQLALLAR